MLVRIPEEEKDKEQEEEDDDEKEQNLCRLLINCVKLLKAEEQVETTKTILTSVENKIKMQNPRPRSIQRPRSRPRPRPRSRPRLTPRPKSRSKQGQE